MLEEHLANPTSVIGLVVDDMQKHPTKSHLRRCSINIGEFGSLAETFTVLVFCPVKISLVDLQLLFDQLAKIRV